MPGRGRPRSQRLAGRDWLGVKADYGFPLYVSDMVTLIARLDVQTVHWVGTSMGGLIGMALASQPHSPITRMVLNDVGPVVTAASLRRINEYLGNAPVFPTMAAAEAYVRAVSTSFGKLTDADWAHLTAYAVRPVEGGFAMIYDPGIAEVFRHTPLLADVDLWGIYKAIRYKAIRCPVLAIRGAESDLLERATLVRMAECGPKAEIVEVPDVGHPPMFLNDEQVGLVRDFLLKGEAPSR